MPAQVQCTPELRAALAECVRAGMSIRRIAERLGVAPHIAWRWSRRLRLGLDPAPTQSRINTARILELAREGRTLRQIAAATGVGISTVRRRLAAHLHIVPPRKRGKRPSARALALAWLRAHPRSTAAAIIAGVQWETRAPSRQGLQDMLVGMKADGVQIRGTRFGKSLAHHYWIVE